MGKNGLRLDGVVSQNWGVSESFDIIIMVIGQNQPINETFVFPNLNCCTKKTK